MLAAALKRAARTRYSGIFQRISATGAEFVDAKRQVLDAMKGVGEPVNAGKVVELTGLDRKAVDKAMGDLKKSGEIESLKRCFWQPARP